MTVPPLGHRPVALDDDALVWADGDARVPLSALDDITFDEGRARSAFVVFTVALLIGPICGGGAFVIHWFLGIVFAVLPILVGMTLLTYGVLRRPRLVLTVDGERQVWRLPHKLDFEAVQAVVTETEERLDARAAQADLSAGTPA